MNILFELGKILTKLALTKSDSAAHLKQLGSPDDEKILLQKIGKFWNQENLFDRPDGLVVVTTYRLVFLSKVKTITAQTDFLSIPLELIEKLEPTRVMLVTPAIRFEVEKRPFMFTFLVGCEDVIKSIEEVLEARQEAASSKACPFCAETIKAAAVMCRYCGRNLPKPNE